MKELTTSYDICRLILMNHKQIEQVNIHSFPDSPPLQDRIVLDEKGEMQLRGALNRREHLKIPFWDSVMLSFFDNEKFSEKILEGVLFEKEPRNKKCVSKDYFLGPEFSELLTKDLNLALNSEVVSTDGDIYHIPMLDFQIPESETNLKVVENVLKVLDIGPGFIFKSGKSYHFIGSNLIHGIGLINLLSKAVLFTPIIDKAWLSHQMLDRSCSLRLTRKEHQFPVVVKEFF